MVSLPEVLERMQRRREAIPLADAATLKDQLRRTTIVRLGLAALLVTLCGVTVWRAATTSPRTVSFLPAHTTTVVVIDQSRSIFVGAYRRIAQTLEKLTAVDVPVGLVAFSDTAYEMLPPGTRSAELTPLLRFYLKGQRGSNVDPQTDYLTSPWDNVFSGGTNISTGLVLAQHILHRDHVENGTILLLSDLETSSEDQAALAQALISIRHDRYVQLRVVPLFPLAVDMDFFQRFFPLTTFVKPSQLQPAGSIQRHTTFLGRMSWSLLAVAGLVLLVLAVNEILCGRLQLTSPQERPA
jgi:hypothetical protein